MNKETEAERRLATVLKEYRPDEKALGKLRAIFAGRPGALAAALEAARNVFRKNAMEKKDEDPPSTH